eukprot:COSAG06_NODE_5628_length_3351_cov_4.592558_4_plen_27_part_01
MNEQKDQIELVEGEGEVARTLLKIEYK